MKDLLKPLILLIINMMCCIVMEIQWLVLIPFIVLILILFYLEKINFFKEIREVIKYKTHN